MTEFNTKSIQGSEFVLTFRTDDRKQFNLMQEMARVCLDFDTLRRRLRASESLDSQDVSSCPCLEDEQS